MIRFLVFLLLFPVLAFAELAVSPEQLDESLAEHIQFSSEGPNYVGHIYIGGHQNQISQGTYLYVKNALDYYKELQPSFIILELDSPGGQVFPAQKISDALKEIDTQYGIPVVAYINNWAISAGAMLAFSSRYITIVKDASMGAAQPVTQTGEGTSEKVNSAIRADFANRAAFFDRNPLIAEAMVDADIILVVRNGEIIELDNNDQIESSDQVITKKGKLLTLNSKELIEWGVADIRLLPEKLSPITEEEKKHGEWPASKELLFTYPFFKQIPNATIKAYKMDWKTQFFAILASPIVTSILFLGLMLGAYIEMSTPGFGIAGIFALVCLFLIVLSSFALQAAGWLEFIMLGVGVGLILIEIFLIPGFGITGILGIILALGGLFALLLPGIREVNFDFDTKTLNAAGQYIVDRFVWLAGAVVVGAVAIALLARFIVPRLGVFSPLVLRGEQERAKGYVAGLAKEALPEVGTQGVVISPLRTAGKVEIQGEIYDAVSSGKFIEKGEKVKVIGVEGSKMIVEEDK
ncbi:MAG: NfeD family protein [Chlamydiales bacterium]